MFIPLLLTVIHGYNLPDIIVYMLRNDYISPDPFKPDHLNEAEQGE